MSRNRIVVVAFAVLCVSALVLADDPTEPITNWTAPPYWTMPAGGQLREQLTGTESSPENQGVSTESASSTSPILPFTAITPCRLVDTRQSPDTPYLDNGGAGETRTYHFDTTSYYSGTGACSLIPAAAALSLSVQFQVTDHQASLIGYPDDVTRPLVASVVAYNTGLFYLNSAIVPTGVDGGIKVFASWGGQVVININGYYAPSNIVTTLNGLTGAVGVTGGTGITVTTGASTLTIAATGGSGGLLPTGTTGQTLYSNGSGWLASSALTNDGTNIGVANNLLLPNAGSGGTSGVIELGGSPFIHNYQSAPGAGNTFVGTNSGNFSMTAAHITAVGAGSLNLNTTGNNNTAIGSYSLASDTIGNHNTAIGFASLNYNTTGKGNTAVGSASLQTQSYDPGTGAPWNSANTAVGFQALNANQPTATSNGVRNVAVGAWSLVTNTTGYDNTATGTWSLYSNTTGYFNTAIGSATLDNNTTGYADTAVGFGSLDQNSLGSANTATGYCSLCSNTTASKNTAFGKSALFTQSYDNGGTPWDSENTAIGYWSMLYTQPDSATDGYRNTAVGSQSLYSNTTGSNNIAFGWYAGYNLTTGNYNIDIGNQGVAAEANTIRIGDSNQTNTYIAGIYGVTISSGSTVLIDSNGQLGTVSSSIRFKQDVADMGDASSRLLDLRPVTFRYKALPDGPRHFGLIAEEVEQVMPELVVRDATGQPETVAYHELPAMLLNELQKQRATIQAQQAQIAAQKAEIDSLKAALAERDGRLAKLDALAERLALIEARLQSK